jgi:carboxypeptidase Q
MIYRFGAACALALFATTPSSAQNVPPADAVIRAIWEEATQRSQVERLAQILLDSLGPRLTGSPGSEAASNWVVSTYRSWGIEARQERYGTWLGWRRGLASVGLVSPRVRSLESTLLAWSPGTNGPITAPALTLPRLSSQAELDTFLEGARGRFVLLTPAEPSCRPPESWERWGRAGASEAAQRARADASRDYAARIQGLRAEPQPGAPPIPSIVLMANLLELSGAAGFLTSRWAEGWGAQQIHDTWSPTVPTFDLSCEDYGLVFRMADGGQAPALRVEADAEVLGEVPVWNTIGVIPGRELPEEYVLLSAHFDSWDGAAGATDNGTGTLTMMEAMRILKAAYPNPKRTLLVGHWNGEEQGLNGSRAFAADHPEIVRGLQALFNQDEGTGRITRISMQGLSGAGAVFRSWMSKMPGELTTEIELVDPGAPSGGGSDEASFICAGAPAFRLTSLSWDYGPYTWHTNRDSFDKVVMDDVRSNAALVAMFAYLAAEEPTRFPRDRAPQAAAAWPACRDGMRSVR